MELRAIKKTMGYKPDLTIESVMEIFKQNFHYEMVLDKKNSFIIKQDGKLFAAKVTLIQKENKTILKINETYDAPNFQIFLIYFAICLFGFFGNIIAVILFFTIFHPKMRKFLGSLEDFAKNCPEFK